MWWWEYARATARRITQGIAPAPVDVWGPVLEPNEVAVMPAEVTYSRLYGGDGLYEPTATYFLGRPAVMIGALAATAAVNHRRKVKARRDAVPSWRDVQHVPVIVTSQRLLAATDAGWESAWWASVAEFQPDLPEWSLTLGFGPGYSPMRLFGPATPALSIWAAAVSGAPIPAWQPSWADGCGRFTVDVTNPAGSYHRRMSTDKFAMEPEATLDGLMNAGQERAAALATGLPSMQAGNYTAGYATAVETVLAAHHAVLTEKTAAGTATAAATVASTEAVEGESAATLSI